jgi:uncharacterized protein YidB (DUF937 family)
MLEQLLKGALQGLAGGSAGSASPLLQLAASLLNNGGRFGGLAGLIRQFEQAGLGSQMASWISTSQNLPVTAEQLMQAIGSGQMQQMAAQVGMEPHALGGELSKLLPQVIDRLTPQGEVPQSGLEDALGMLGKLVR